MKKKSAKDRFLETTEARSHYDAVAQSWFTKSIEAALQQMMEEKVIPVPATEAAVNQMHLVGARRFIDIFENISTVTQRVAHRDPSALPHP